MTIRAFSGFEGVSKEVAGYVGRGGGTAANVTVQSAIVHAGRYAGRINSTGGTNYFQFEFEQNDPTTWLAARGYAVASTGCFVELQLWLDSLPAVDTEIATIVVGPISVTGAIRVVLTSTGALKLQYQASGGWTNVGSASSALSTSAWHKVQFGVTGLLNSGTTSAGTAELIIDGSAIASGSSLPIIADNKYQWVWLGNDVTNSTYRVYFDDVIVDDTAYPTVNLCEVPVLVPDSAGTDSAWTGTFADVDETLPDDNTTYITITANGAHTFGMSSTALSHILSDTNIKAVQAVAYINMVNFDGATRTQTRVRSGATTQDTAWSVAPGNGFYGPSRVFMLTDPNTGAAWTKAALDALEVGVSKTAGIQEVRTTAVYVSVLAPLVARDPAPAPTVTAITPSSGPKAGGTAVTITGTQFDSATQVLIGGVAATGVTVVSATSITCTTAAVSKAGVASVTVVAPQGSGTLINAFTFTPGNSSGNGGNNAGGTTTLVVPFPAGIAAGDMLALVVDVVGGTGVTITPATTNGTWNLLARTNSTTILAHAAYWKVATAGDVSTGSITLTITSAKASGVTLKVPDVDTSVAPQYSAQANASSVNVVAPTLTPQRLGSVSVVGAGLQTGTTVSPPTSYTEPAGADSASTGGSVGTRTTTEGSYRTLTTLTATGTVTAVAAAAAINIGGQFMFAPPTVIAPVAIDSAESVGSPTLSQPAGITSIQPTAIASAVSFGTFALLKGNVNIAPTGITSGEAVGTPSLVPVARILPSGVASGEALGTPTLLPGSVSIQPGAIASAEALGVPTLVLSNISIVPTAIASGEALGAPTLLHGGVVIAPTAIASGEVLGNPTLLPGNVFIQPTAIASSEAVGTSTLVSVGGPLSILPSAIASAEALGTPTLVATANVLPTAVPSAEALGTPTLVATANILPTAIPSGEVLGTPTLLPGAVSIQPTAIASAEAFGAVTLKATANILPSAVASGEGVGNPSLLPAGVTVAPSSIPTAEAVGTPTLIASAVILPSAIGSAEAVGNSTLLAVASIQPTGILTAQVVGTPGLIATATILPTAVPSVEALGNPTLQATASILPSAIGSAEALGTPSLAVGGVLIQPTGIASVEALGTPLLVGQATVITPAGIPTAEAVGTPQLRLSSLSVQAIPSAEAVGTPTLIPTANILPTAIPSGQALGNPTLLPVAQISPTGIASAEAVGTPTVKAGNVNVSPTAITTGEVSGSPTVLPGAVSIGPTAIGSQEALGTPTIVKGGVQITPNGVGSAEVLGNPTLQPGNTNAVLTGIPSAEVVGLPALLASARIVPDAIASAEVFGLPVVALNPIFIRPTGIVSGELVGNPSLLLLNAGWSWLNNSPDFGETKTRGRTELQDGYEHTKERGYPELQDALAHTKRSEGSS